jgi:hypothetical protein
VTTSPPAAEAASDPVDDKPESRLSDGEAPNGEPIISVIFGMTFDVAKDGACSAKGYRIVEEWKYVKARVATKFTKPSLLVRDTDLYAWRNLTDVVVQGTARSESPVKSMELALSVSGSDAKFERPLVVTGDRWVDARRGTATLSDPEPFTEMPLTYDRAYGGTDEVAEERFADPELLNFFVTQIDARENEELSEFSYPRNPAGRGYLVDGGGLHGMAWPNLEFPESRLKLDSVVQPLERWGERPYPAGFDWFAHAWFPRQAFALDFPETHDEKLPEVERKLGLFDPGFEDKTIPERPKHPFANGAHPFLARRRLNGKETIRVTKTSRDGRDFFAKLPGLEPKVSLRIPGEPKVVLPAALDLVFVETELDQVTLLWRATHFTKKEHIPMEWLYGTDYDIAY